MTNSPTPNRRRRLTADELIAVVVAMTGIGSILFWSLGQKYPGFNLASLNPASLTATNNGTNITTTPTIGGMTGAETKNTEIRLNPNPSTATAIATGAVVGANTGIPTESNTTQKTRIVDDEDNRDRPTTSNVTTTAPATTAVAPAVTTPAATTPTTATPLPTTSAVPFKDVPKAFWGENYITALQQRGVLDDFGTGKFDPNLPITRGEFAKMIDRAFRDRQANKTKLGFKDIPAKYQRKSAIDRSVNLGFMTGYSPTKFAPDQPIPRYQMQISLAKGLKLQPTGNPDSVLGKFSDASEMPPYTRDKMASAISADIVVKDEQPTNLKPTQNATRADAVALIYQALVKEGKIIPTTEAPKATP
jgi:hypothetical protein